MNNRREDPGIKRSVPIEDRKRQEKTVKRRKFIAYDEILTEPWTG